MHDPFNLNRFILAQQKIYQHVLDELQSGYKASHWMWFVFPQLLGLGQSPTSRYYAIQSRDEAAAYMVHPVLGSRLIECTEIVVATNGRSIEQIFGTIDAMKFHSSMTLFLHISSTENHLFNRALQKYFNGVADTMTLDILGRSIT